MKAKTIEKDILSTITKWALSIENKELQDLAINEAVVTGGCIASMFLQDPVNDYDIYFKNISTTFKLTCYYVEKMKQTSSAPLAIRITYDSPNDANLALKTSIGSGCIAIGNYESEQDYESEYHKEGFWDNKLILKVNPDTFTKPQDQISDFLDNANRVEVFVKSSGLAENDDLDQHEHSVEENGKYRPVFLSSNAITLSDKIQLVIRFIGTPAQIHESYDFVHATNYWTAKEGLVTNSEALEALLAKELVYRGSKYPLASIFRTRKFIKRDWNLHIGNYVKMAMQLNEFDLNDLATLEEQLTGVDSLYMHSIISAIKSKRKDDESFKFNSLYVCELCDRMMGLRKEIDGDS